MTIFLVSLAGLFILPGLLFGVVNWYCFFVWGWRKYRDPRYRKGPGDNGNIGGFLLFIGVVILMEAVPEMRNAWWLFVVAAVADYSFLPSLVLAPLMGYLLNSRKAPPRTLPKPPYCQEVRLGFPLLLVGDDEMPELVCSAESLSRYAAEQGAVLYADSLCQHVVQVHGRKKSFGSPEVEYTTPRPYKLEKLLKLQARLIREDDDALTQFHEASELLLLLKQCATFPEYIALGCLAGWWEAPAGSGLPKLCESDLDMEAIRAAGEASVTASMTNTPHAPSEP